ncbi:MAG: hypothetical protein VKJ09_01235 [Leptolyngbya sp.]|nr:hypothetical protein [Leptolyngbya sp.]
MADPDPHSKRRSPAIGAPGARSRPAAVGRVKLWVQSRPQEAGWMPWLRRGLVSLALAGAIAAVGGTLGLSLTLLLRPQPPRWLVRFLPHTAATWNQSDPQTQAQIQAELVAQGQEPGDWIDLTTWGTDPNLDGLWLLPVWATRSPCTQDCRLLVALRLYGYHRTTPEGDTFQAIDTLTVQNPDATTVLAPLVRAGVEVPNIQDRLPLRHLHPYDQPDLPGVWLALSGSWRQGGQPVLYGQVVYIDPRLLGLRSLLTWSSPPRQRPTWVNLDQQGPPELVVNQSVGLEPDLQGYTLAGGGDSLFAQRLVAVDLLQGVVDGPEQGNYELALTLAQNGLWSLASLRLTAIKNRLGEQWPPAAERQLQLIARHGAITQAQAEGNWAQPTQKILALLIDGRWQPALDQLQSPGDSLKTSLLPLLAEDPAGRLWQRVNAALRVDRRQDAARLWGALLLLAKQDRAAADRWLAQAPNGSTLQTQLGAIVTALTPPKTVPVTNPTAPTTPSPTIAPHRWVGTAEGLNGITLEQWTPLPGQTLALPQGQRWYRLQVQRVLEGDQWQNSGTVGEAVDRIAQWGGDRPWQLIHPVNGGAIAITIQAMAAEPGTGALLAYGPDPGQPGPWLAIAGGQFEALETLGGEPLTPLATGETAPPWQTTLANLGTWPPAAPPATVRQRDLTGDGKGEILVTDPQGGTVILAAHGAVLYQGGRDRPLLGWVLGGPATLLVTGGDGYGWLAWSPSQQRFMP